MRRVWIVACLLLAGCASNPIPDGYSGPVAEISDTFGAAGGVSANFFFLEKIDGNTIANALSATTAANRGNGFSMRPVDYTRNVPAQPSSFTITGRTHYAAPILELTGTVYHVSGEVKFAPLPNHHYVVTGHMDAFSSVVWIEDADSHAVIGDKIEVKGSSALGFFEK